MSPVNPEYIELGRQLLQRIDGQDRELAATIIGGSIQLTIEANKEPLIHALKTSEAALRDAEEIIPRASVISDMMLNHGMAHIRKAIQEVKLLIS